MLRVWFSGKMSPCQGLVGSSILPTRTKKIINLYLSKFMFYQIIGFAGTILVVLAYFLNSFKKEKLNIYIYQILNLFGAIFIGINVFKQEAWPALVLQIIWVIIALYSLFKRIK
jgi:paired small multidrug resistance pump